MLKNPSFDLDLNLLRRVESEQRVCGTKGPRAFFFFSELESRDIDGWK